MTENTIRRPAAEELYLEIVLTEKEVQEAATRLAERTQKRAEVEDQKKAVTADLSAQIKAIEAEANVSALHVVTGRTHRYVPCRVTYDDKAGTKRWTRRPLR